MGKGKFYLHKEKNISEATLKMGWIPGLCLEHSKSNAKPFLSNDQNSPKN